MNIIKEAAVKVVIGWSNLYFKMDKMLQEKTGKGLVDRQTEWRDKEEKEKDESPIKWASKKLLKGTVQGIIGGTLSSNK